jgi:hypothetical protein
MGIPRLSHDLLPYAERACLGTGGTSAESAQRPEADTSAVITSLVIDGPSLVYFAYNKLLAYRYSAGTTVLLPTYSEINEAVHHFLSELQAHGVAVHHVYFDGGLPEAKRAVRLERMERLRQQLETYRKTYPDFPPSTKPVRPDMDSILWNAVPTVSSKRLTLPAPPFMVASVIESLRKDAEWKDRVQIVPGEADTFCAVAASRSGAAVLTNDSDLVVHDLGTEGRVVLLHSVEKRARSASSKDTVIGASALHPKRIAERLNVPSLLRYGFERFLDPSISTSAARERARDDDKLTEKRRAEYDVFAEQYLAIPSPTLLGPLNDLDPRTAELVVNLPQSGHIYLTPMVEDPSRDSSWSYGTEVRRLACSLLSANNGTPAVITEYARRGRRITSTNVSIAQGLELRASLASITEQLNPDKDWQTFASDPRLVLLHRYILAFDVVCKQKLAAGKPLPAVAQITRILGLRPSSPSTATPPPKISWDDIHLLANMQAVLYSLRMLAQITRYVLGASSGHAAGETGPNKDLENDLRSLSATLEPMPDIHGLFLDPSHLRSRVSTLDLGVKNAATTILGQMLNPQHHDTGEHGRAEELARSQAVRDEKGQGEWIHKTKKRKRQKTSEPRPKSGLNSKNIFDLLMDE